MITATENDIVYWSSRDKSRRHSISFVPHETATLSGSLARTLSDRIPLEVVERIIDRMEWATLLTAVRVSRAWYPRAMYDLYLAIEIRSRTSFKLLERLLRTSPPIKRWLASTYSLTIGYDRPPYINVAPIVLARAMPDLREMVFLWVSLDHPIHPVFYSALSHFRHLTALRLLQVRLRNSNQLQQILGAFPRLTELVFNGVSFHRQDTATPHFSRNLNTEMALESLHVTIRGIRSHVAFEYIVDALMWSTLCTSLRNLEVRIVSEGDGLCDVELGCDDVNRLLGASGPSLQSFDAIFLNLESAAGAINFTKNTSLRDMEITSRVRASTPRESWVLDAAVSLRSSGLSTVRSYHLKHVKLRPILSFNDDDSLGLYSPFRERVDSEVRSLHNDMALPYYDLLESAEVEVIIHFEAKNGGNHATEDVAIAQAVVAQYRRLFEPWDDRGIVNISCKTVTHWNDNPYEPDEPGARTSSEEPVRCSLTACLHADTRLTMRIEVADTAQIHRTNSEPDFPPPLRLAPRRGIIAKRPADGSNTANPIFPGPSAKSVDRLSTWDSVPRTRSH
ncbi:uncharacterized protein C8Q71DRAFT_576532 [Rhodofomes roseus]|uniref:F-box domain-containing protein n=1 Tax=Rhodofomes roseus TaxID=34475 RepID=A0ABQ8KJC4_9APHY|nr:uncharacterized protein C8Q71DRAFT_576532 [Rhodofomes roseus]KAH9838063.1 hypothetical protein C8Q71DRAFT_576532 [Rhodofomes roseus]